MSSPAKRTYVSKRRPGLLVVDDDVATCSVLCDVFDKEYVVRSAHSCAEAIKAVETFEPNVAILDYNLPDGTGLSLVPMLRAINPMISTVLFSGNLADAMNSPGYRSVGVDVALSKPISLDRIKNAVKVSMDMQSHHANDSG